MNTPKPSTVARSPAATSASSAPASAAADARPLVSIGVPVYNGARYLAAALHSTCNQTYPNLEIIIHDNASTDRSGTISREMKEADARITYSRNDRNIGAAPNFNNVFKQSSGTYFKWAAHDDLLLPRFIERCVDEFERREAAGETVAVVHPHTVMIGDDGEVVNSVPKEFRADTRWRPYRVFQCVRSTHRWANPVFGLISRRALAETRLIDRFISSDYVLLLELALRGNFVKVEEPLFQRRIHPGMSTKANRDKAARLRWFSPEATQQERETHRLWKEYFRSVGAYERLSTVEKAACYVAIVLGMTFFYGAKWRYRLLHPSAS